MFIVVKWPIEAVDKSQLIQFCMHDNSEALRYLQLAWRLNGWLYDLSR